MTRGPGSALGGDDRDSAMSLAARANAQQELVEELIARDVVAVDDPRAVGRVRLFAAWVQAGLSLDTVLELVRRRVLSLAFLDTPAVRTAPRLDLTFEELPRTRRIPQRSVDDLYAALGFEAPRRDARVGEDDVVLLDLLDTFSGAGVPHGAVMRLYGVYAENLRRIAKAEAEFYETNIEQPLRAEGLDEEELMRFGGEFGVRVNDRRERALQMLYQRHREHVWFEHAIGHVEAALDESDIDAAVAAPPSICFVDLTGYTRLTEERGDEFAAEVAGRLSSLVKEVSRRHGGGAIRWLGDGGMYRFRDAAAAVAAGLDMVSSAPTVGLPPAHIGIHTGPVISQDGDVYGRTVNLAARIASVAEAGQVVVSADARDRASTPGGETFRFEHLGSYALKGVGGEIPLFQAFRNGTS